ncbi:MAG: hypothetical protein ABEJ30_09905 [Halorientalis sp.]
MASPTRRRRLVAPLLGVAAGTVLFAGSAAAHGGSLGAAARESLAVPTWLFLLTGGAAVGASFLLASFVTDRTFLRRLHAWQVPVTVPGRAVMVPLARLAGVSALLAVIGFGLLGPPAPLANLGVLLVWVAWWAGFTATTYLVGNAWPLVDPWRTIAGALPALDRGYPDRLAAWSGVAGLLALVWLEVVSPLADAPRLLAAVVVGYTALTLAGATALGSDRWFGTVDPIARVFRYYGHVAPLTRDADAGGLRLRVPGSGLVGGDVVTDFDEAAFVVAVLWVTTYDGLVATPAWADVARALVGAGVPAPLLYPAALLGGFALFLAAYRLAARASRRTADTYRTGRSLAVSFAPSLVPIAAGYHLAHYAEYVLALLPAVLAALASPLAPAAAVPVAQVPAWFGGVSLACVLLGHLLGIWVAHATAYDMFPGRLQAVRSQYPLVLVMVCYTATSLWIVSQPTVQPPFL